MAIEEPTTCPYCGHPLDDRRYCTNPGNREPVYIESDEERRELDAMWEQEDDK